MNIKDIFLGLDTKYETANKEITKRVYLDSSATTLVFKPTIDAFHEIITHYGNIHSNLHNDAAISTESFDWAHDSALDFVNADKDKYSCLFLGTGSTSAINRFSSKISRLFPEKELILTSLMEHHSNDLPHRFYFKEVHHISLSIGMDEKKASVCLQSLEAELQKNKDSIAFVAVSLMSNVTGIINKIHEIAEITHKYEKILLVDATQAAAHIPINMSLIKRPNAYIDALVFSGHKIYTPASPGVLIVRKDLLEKTDVVEYGGGIVKDVSRKDFSLSQDIIHREYAGTPNISGTIMLGVTLKLLSTIGMGNIYEHEIGLTKNLISKLQSIPNISIYGSLSTDVSRISATSFNIKGIPHSLITAILNDYFNIAVRNECFCAHPYVRELLLPELWDIDLDDENIVNELDYVDEWRGMVRVSLGIYNTEEDIDNLIQALINIEKNIDFYRSKYEKNGKDYKHKTYKCPETISFADKLTDSLVSKYQLDKVTELQATFI